MTSIERVLQNRHLFCFSFFAGFQLCNNRTDYVRKHLAALNVKMNQMTLISNVFLKQFILISMQYVLISKLFHEECSSSKPPSFAAFKRLWSSKLVSVYGYPIQEECLNAYIVYIYKSTIVLTHTAVTKSLSSSRCLFWRLPGGSWSAKLPCCTPEQCYHVLLILEIIPCHTGGVYKRSAKTIANSLQILIVRSTKVEIKTLTSAYLHWEIEKNTQETMHILCCQSVSEK